MFFTIGQVAWAQVVLNPGTYKGHVFEGGVICQDSGAYVFEGVHFNVAVGKVGLEAATGARLEVKQSEFLLEAGAVGIRTNGEIRVEGCRFERDVLKRKPLGIGEDSAIGIAAAIDTGKDLQISKSWFLALRTGISIDKAVGHGFRNDKMKIEGNHLVDNRTGLYFRGFALDGSSPTGYALEVRRNTIEGSLVAIDLQRKSNSYPVPSLDFRLHCNTFQQGNSLYGSPRIGVRIGDGNLLDGNKIGFEIPQGDQMPSGNLWPINGNPSRENYPCTSLQDAEGICGTSTWVSPTNWISIKNESANGITYNRFYNELVGTVSPTSGTNLVFKKKTDYRVYTQANVDNGFDPDPTTDIEVCPEEASPLIVYPTRPGNIDSLAVTGSAGLIRSRMEIKAWPNPGSGTIRFEAGNSGPTTITVYDLLSGKPLASGTTKAGAGLSLDLSGFGPGMYYFIGRNEVGESAPGKLILNR